MSSESQRNEIRKRIKNLRSEQTELERGARSAAIGEMLGSLHEFQAARKVAFYSSTQGEVKTDEMIDSALREGKKISVPMVNAKSPEITFHQIRSRKNLKLGEYGILEPHENDENVMNADELDVIVVPGIAFDPKCERLGYGKGYYDLFLKEIGSLKVGLAFDFQIVPEINRRGGDVRMDFVVTESRLFQCGVTNVGKDLIHQQK